MQSIHSSFTDKFVWGAATAAYQIEGAPSEDGKGESIWDRFSHTSGKIQDSHTADIACDSYHRYADDVALLKAIHMGGYRFSIAWPRIYPMGTGARNEAGLAYYDHLVDLLLENGIEPYITLYHWDLPQALQDRGGWENRETAYHFADYAATMIARLGDRVTHWMTHNEPWVTAMLGHQLGIFAPGFMNMRSALQVAHHLLLSHGLAIPAMRAAASRPLEIGIALNMEPAYSASDKAEDSAAARRHDGYINRWFLDPLVGRGYPADMWAYYADLVPQVETGDLETIATPIDFIGVNYYNRITAVHAPNKPLPQAANHPDPDQPRTDDRETYPEGLYDVLTRLHQEYGFPSIYITENGAAYPDRLESDGHVHDTNRIIFLKEHFAQAQRSLEANVPLRGYFIWSLLDNFEWASGFSLRYGLTFIEYATGRRILKDSALWLSHFLSEASGIGPPAKA